jgi:hypothetical protein
MQGEVPFLAANDGGQRADWTAKALSYSGQLAVYRDALSRAEGSQARNWIHVAVGGGAISLIDCLG